MTPLTESTLIHPLPDVLVRLKETTVRHLQQEQEALAAAARVRLEQEAGRTEAHWQALLEMLGREGLDVLAVLASRPAGFHHADAGCPLVFNFEGHLPLLVLCEYPANLHHEEDEETTPDGWRLAQRPFRVRDSAAVRDFAGLGRALLAAQVPF